MIDKNLKEKMDDVLSAKKHFEKLETNGGDVRESLKDVLISRFKWNKEILDKSKNPLVRLDIKGVPFIAPHPSIESAIIAAGKEDACNTEISIYDILVPGGVICFDSASMHNAGIKSFISVVLPLPLAPRTPNISPLDTDSVRPSRTFKFP